METRTIGDGAAALTVSVVGLGCNAFGRRIDEARSAAVVHAALDAGITFFDTAESYGGGESETFIGRALGKRRRDVVIATKFGWGPGGAGAAGIARAVEGSLRRLGTDCIDLYQLHKPDSATPHEETLQALDALVRAGKVRQIGCSNFSAAQLEAAEAAAAACGTARYVTAQNEYSVLDRGIEDGLAPVCEALGVGILPFYPLARGLLTGKYRRGEAPPPGSRLAAGGDWRVSGTLEQADFDTLEALEGFAAARRHDLLALAFSWLLAQKTVPTVIAGATRPEQVAANAAAASWTMTGDDLAEIDRILGVA
jgi:aryl-alcohol dehydrogenase-like predicted oxidoreductase